MRRVFVIGLDGATLDLIGPWAAQGELPAFSRLMREGVSGPLPRSLVYHDFRTSFRRVYTRRELKNLSNRNRFLFQWYAIPSLSIKHIKIVQEVEEEWP